MQAAVENGINGIDAACGGTCSCATCMVYVDDGWYEALPPKQAAEESMLEFNLGANETSRLACQINLTAEHDGLEVTLPESQL